MELHLDLVGGLAGDMFIAALLDAFPQHERRVQAAIASISTQYPVACMLLAHRDHVLQGRRFEVKALTGIATSGAAADQPCVVLATPSPSHAHACWKSIRARLIDASIPRNEFSAGARSHALAIFQLLAEAEAFVHGVPADSVEFHEVGAWDSIADIVGAATLIDAIGATRWTASPVPLGSGRVKTAHGTLPVPAPATTRLLMGMPMLDDGVGGERVTPTGAAILRYLCPPGMRRHAFPARTLVASGTGFGQRTLLGLSNHVRVLCFEKCAASLAPREISVLEFEVDDQSGEDLAAGLDRLRAQAGILDVTQTPVFGKKGRIMVHVCVLVRSADMDAAVEACFMQTTTIGLRHRTVQGIGLNRRMENVEVDGARLRVKVVDRPGGTTAKAESDDALSQGDHAQRAALRQRAERTLLHAKGVPIDA